MNGHNSQVAYKKLSVLPTPMSALTKQHLEQNQNDDKYKNKNFQQKQYEAALRRDTDP